MEFRRVLFRSRVNTLGRTAADVIASLSSAGVEARQSELVPGAFIVEGGTPPAVSRAAEEGLVYIQDQASQLVSLLLGAEASHRVLDLCAAPGSKSSHIAALTSGDAWIMACDIHHHRLVTLRATCERLGVRSLDAVALDATRELPIAEGASKFDRVLIDAPCSGTGTLRRNPEIKWRLAPGDMARLAELQLSLLDRAAGVVMPGGRLVYSTCSVEPEENEAVVGRFLGGGARFRLVTPSARPELITPDGFVRTFPHRHASDGFFAAVLEKL
jgi:16S rRNA (cytosine967-C5)-methyltransferase